MKTTCKIFLVAGLLIASAVIAQAQMPAAVTDPKVPVTWLGLDFEEALIVGDTSLDMASFKGIYTKRINDMIMNNPKRYDLRKYLLKDSVSYDISMLEESNRYIFEDHFVPAAPGLQSFSTNELEALVNHYSFKKQEGVGVVLIVRAMNRAKAKFTANLTYVDMANKTILYTKEFTVSAGGVEWAAYWTNAVRRVLMGMQKEVKKATRP